MIDKNICNERMPQCTAQVMGLCLWIFTADLSMIVSFLHSVLLFEILTFVLHLSASNSCHIPFLYKETVANLIK